jgi:hypothetical protein
MKSAIFRDLHDRSSYCSTEKSRFQNILQNIVSMMRSDLRTMWVNDPVGYSQHKIHVGTVLGHITTYCRDLCPLEPSPDENDFYMLSQHKIFAVATIRNYSLRLDTSRGRKELSHYIFAKFKHAAIENKLDEALSHLSTAMGNGAEPWSNLFNHVMTIFTPSLVHVGFASNTGWLLAKPFLELAQSQLRALAPVDCTAALQGLKPIFQTIVNGIQLLSVTRPHQLYYSLAWERYFMLTLVFRFMTSALEWMSSGIDQSTEVYGHDLLLDISYVDEFATGAKAFFDNPLRTFMHSLKCSENYNEDDLNLDELIENYEKACESPVHHLREAALAALITPFDMGAHGRDFEEFIEALHNRSVVGGFVIFSGVDKFVHFKDRNNVTRRKAVPLRGVPEFSQIILEDIRDNWLVTELETEERQRIEIRTGREWKQATHNVEEYLAKAGEDLSLKGLYKGFERSVELYIKQSKAFAATRSDYIKIQQALEAENEENGGWF